MPILKPYLGRGLRLPLKPGPDGGFEKDIDSERIIQSSVNVILLTRLYFADNGNPVGERVWRPDFGSNVTNLKHEPNVESTFRKVKRSIIDPIRKWERRIKDLTINIIPSPNDPYAVFVFLSYKIISSNEDGNLVFPLFLR